MGVYLKIPSNGVPTGRINYESDFIVKIILNKKVGDRDFKIDFFTNPTRMVRFTRYNGVMSSNLKASDDGGILAVFRKHELTPGRLQVKATFVTKTDVSPDGEMSDILPIVTDVELVADAGDMGLIPIIELSLTQYFPSTDDDDGSNEGEGDNNNQNSAPITFVPSITPDSVANTKTIKTTVITADRPIASFDGENVKLLTPNGIKFLGYGGGEYVVADDKLSITINWDIDAVEGEYELRVPKGCIVLEDGAENEPTNIVYNVTIAPIVYFDAIVLPMGNVTAETIKHMVIKFPSAIESFDGSNVRFAKNFGSVWYDYAATGTISDDRLSMTIEWDFAPEVGLTYTLELPEGCITLKNGDKNAEKKIPYVVVSAE